VIYLLDTNAISALMKLKEPVVERFRSIPASVCAVSVISEHELVYGACRSPNRDVYLNRLDILQFPVLDFTRTDARQAGEIRARLSLQGIPIGPLDALIAAQALARDLTLVTHNTREFARVPDLRIEDWET
jgi:tRNA(fMet)-specific endonuclease VapC